MNGAPEYQRGLALGAWGAVQASAAGIAGSRARAGPTRRRGTDSLLGG